MRENIGLYKAKRIDNGEWVEGCLSVLNDECMIAIGYGHHNELDNPHCMWVDVDKDTVSQFTGLKDKNGNMIFENDIVKCAIENPSTGKVEKYFNCIVSYCKTLNAMGWYGKDERDVINKIPARQDYIEIIGNIFDNKEKEVINKAKQEVINELLEWSSKELSLYTVPNKDYEYPDSILFSHYKVFTDDLKQKLNEMKGGRQ